MNRETILATGRRVATREAEALNDLAASLGDAFVTAAETLLAARGRVIVSGIGKSGHIARKIASTFASTGTPAQFVHPAEASHGDLGMVTKDDVALAISFSGEAPELSDLVAFTRRFGIPLIALTGNADSSLGRQSDIVLELPPVTEACQTGIVPTTSTTMTLALGDALAIALMEHREFTVEHFREFHPGGKLGARLARVRDLMHDDPPVVAEGTGMPEALITMTQRGFGVVGVVDDEGFLTGIVTDGDLRRHMDGLLTMKAREVMTASPKIIAPGALAAEALAIMNKAKITCLLVCEGEDHPRPIGILQVHDCLRAGLA